MGVNDTIGETSYYFVDLFARNHLKKPYTEALWSFTSFTRLLTINHIAIYFQCNAFYLLHVMGWLSWWIAIVDWLPSALKFQSLLSARAFSERRHLLCLLKENRVLIWISQKQLRIFRRKNETNTKYSIFGSEHRHPLSQLIMTYLPTVDVGSSSQTTTPTHKTYKAKGREATLPLFIVALCLSESFKEFERTQYK